MRKTKLQKTLLNWKWWLVLVPVILMMLPVYVIHLLHLIFTFMSNLTDILDTPSPKFLKKLIDWVHKEQSK